MISSGVIFQTFTTLVAQYADACNLYPSPELPEVLAALRGHCERLGRDYDAIEKTAIFSFDVGEDGGNIEQLIGTCGWLASMGIEIAQSLLLAAAAD